MTVRVAAGFGMPWSGMSSRRAVCLCPEGGNILAQGRQRPCAKCHPVLRKEGRGKAGMSKCKE